MSYIAETLRQLVIERANYACEYCFIHQDDSLYTHEIDHIIPIKHRGTTEEHNLCLACLECNRHKGSDFSSFDIETNIITPIFNPRQQSWHDHFMFDGIHIMPLSAVGRVTSFVLKLNDENRLRIRYALNKAGRYPPSDFK